MTTEVTININDYLSEEEKKEIAIDVFRAQVKKELFKSNDGTVQADAEIQRVIGNITHQIVMDEVSKYIPNFKKLIIDKTTEVITTEKLSYHVFKRKDVWERDESLAIKYINETVKTHEGDIKERIKKEISEYDLNPTITEKVSEVFDTLASNYYELSNLFLNKDKP